jgi:2-polyprenyl-3-methyl-5-hydroxy-6-metoxy-1,4-benzoquinol methylase
MCETDREYVAWKNWKKEDFGKFDKWQAAYFEAEVLRRLDGPKGRILEIGFGNGAFLGFAKANGFDVVGIEANDLLVERALATGLTACKRVSDLPSADFFDAIVLFDVLEHIEQYEIAGFLQSLHARLKTNGRLIARFPNGDSPFGRIIQHGDLTHCTTLGRHKVFQLAAIAGFEIEYLGNPAVSTKGVSSRAAVSLFFRGILSKAVELSVSKLFFSGERVSLQPNYLLVLSKAAK